MSTVGYTSIVASAIHRRQCHSGLTNLIHDRCSVK